jgi:hypothetical protein
MSHADGRDSCDGERSVRRWMPKPDANQLALTGKVSYFDFYDRGEWGEDCFIVTLRIPLQRDQTKMVVPIVQLPP